MDSNVPQHQFLMHNRSPTSQKVSEHEACDSNFTASCYISGQTAHTHRRHAPELRRFQLRNTTQLKPSYRNLTCIGSNFSHCSDATHVIVSNCFSKAASDNRFRPTLVKSKWSANKQWSSTPTLKSSYSLKLRSFVSKTSREVPLALIPAGAHAKKVMVAFGCILSGDELGRQRLLLEVRKMQKSTSSNMSRCTLRVFSFRQNETRLCWVTESGHCPYEGRWVRTSGLGTGGAGNACALPKVLICRKSGQNPGKFGQTVDTFCYLCNESDWAKKNV